MPKSTRSWKKAGIFTDPALMVELRRPADVLIKLARTDLAGTGTAPAPAERVALDVKVINACGPAHMATWDKPDPQVAMRNYAAKANTISDTEALGTAHGVRYAPIVFTAQGGRSTAADEVLARLAALVETREAVPAADVLAAFHQQVSRLLVVQAVRTCVRRARRIPARAPAPPLEQILLGAVVRQVAGAGLRADEDAASGDEDAQPVDRAWDVAPPRGRPPPRMAP